MAIARKKLLKKDEIVTASAKEQAEDIVRKARLLARSVMPYFTLGLNAMSINIDERAKDDAGNATFAVDAKMRMYAHPEAINKWVEEAKAISPTNKCLTCGKAHHHPLAYIAGVLVHEMLHPMRKHFKRMEAYDQKTFDYIVGNFAQDAELNDSLVDFSKTSTYDRLCLPAGAILPSTYKMPDNLLWEEYYKLLMDKIEKGEIKRVQMPASGRCGSGADGKKRGYEKDADGRDPGNPSGGVDEGVDEGELEIISKRTAQEVKNHHSKKPGEVPGGLVRWADEQLAPPKYNWKRELTQRVRYAVSRYVTGCKSPTYSSLARICSVLNHEVILPTFKRPVPEVAIIIDTSGSMHKALLDQALAEAEGILRAVKANVNVISCDTVAHAKQVKRMSQATHLQGNGGTSMKAGVEKALQARNKPGLIIILTDGYDNFTFDRPKNSRVIVGLIGTGHDCSDQAIPAWCDIIRISDL